MYRAYPGVLPRDAPEKDYFETTAKWESFLSEELRLSPAPL